MIGLLSVMALTTGVSAQDKPQQRNDRPQMTQEERIKARVESLNKELTLTDAQQQELTKIFTEQAKKMETMRASAKKDTTANKEDARKAAGEQFRKMQEETNAAIKKTLGEEKYKQYQELQKKRMQQMQQRRPRPDGPGRPDGPRPDGPGWPNDFRPDGPMGNGPMGREME